MEKLSAKRRALTALRRGVQIDGDVSVDQASSTSERSRARKEARLASLFRRYGAWLARVLRKRYGDQAEDITQETFLRVARYGEAGAVIRHPKALLLRIAHNAATDQSRRHADRIARDAVVIDLADYLHEPAQSADQVELVLLKQLILGMPTTYRDVFILSRFKAMSYAEIAAVQAISVKTVEWRMSKALAYCLEALSDRFEIPDV